jgi:uncharacterized protein (TIGR03437 family)
MVVDNNATNAYILTATGLSILPLDAIPAVDRPVINPSGTVSLASYLPQIAQGGLISIFGRNLAQQAAATGAPLPRSLGGVCVTLNNNPLPLLMTSPTQINAQIPPELAAGRYSLIVRAFSRNLASAAQQITVAKYAPAVLVDTVNKQAAVYDEEGRYISPSNPTTRDRRVKIYAVGLGPTKGPRVLGGDAAPENAVTDPLTVFFGDPRYSQADVAVEYSKLLPGFIGIYEIQVYVPWDRIRGKELPVTLRIGGISSPSTGPALPTIAVE